MYLWLVGYPSDGATAHLYTDMEQLARARRRHVAHELLRHAVVVEIEGGDVLEAVDHLVKATVAEDGESRVEEVFNVEHAHAAPTTGGERLQHLHGYHK